MCNSNSDVLTLLTDMNDMLSEEVFQQKKITFEEAY